MQKRHPGEGGAVLLGGDHAILTKTRPVLQANRAAKVRLANLLLARRWGAPPAII